VVQFDYTQLATYAPDFRRIATFLFEHDVYFQSVARGIGAVSNPFIWTKHAYEYLRALRFERQALGRFDEIQACTDVNKRHLESYVWNSAPIYAGLRAGIDVSRYRYVETGREAGTILFVGNFQHPPNQEALNFFVREAWPAIQHRHGEARLVVVGAQSTPGFRLGFERPGIEFLGEVEDIREALERCAVFVCPILSGSGVRGKLLEAFAAGIPVVSTTLGAEGLLRDGAHLVELASDGHEFAERVCDLLDRPEYATDLARCARREVEQYWDMAVITRKLEKRYRAVLREKLARAGNLRDGPALDLGPHSDLPLALAEPHAGVRSRDSDAS
jgi:glycosyltransferase involved in cell wall biosynthesis